MPRRLSLSLLMFAAGVALLVAASVADPVDSASAGAAAGSSRAAGDAAPVSAAAVSAALSHTCALTSTGAVRCWGYNGHDELGVAGWPDSSSPNAVPGLSDGVTAIAAGVRHSCAVTRAGGATCWGFFRSGAL